MTEPQPVKSARNVPMPKPLVYPFLLTHVFVFGYGIFAMSYKAGVDAETVYIFGSFAATIYVVFYIDNFGFDEVKWMFINAGLGVFGL